MRLNCRHKNVKVEPKSCIATLKSDADALVWQCDHKTNAKDVEIDIMVVDLVKTLNKLRKVSKKLD